MRSLSLIRAIWRWTVCSVLMVSLLVCQLAYVPRPRSSWSVSVLLDDGARLRLDLLTIHSTANSEADRSLTGMGIEGRHSKRIPLTTDT